MKVMKFSIMRRFVTIPIAAAVAAVVAACLPTEVCGCTPIEPVVYLDGLVEDTAGAPVADAEVVVDYYAEARTSLSRSSCDGEFRYTVTTAESGSDGSWDVTLWEVPPPACFLIRTTPPAGSGLGVGHLRLMHTQERPLPFGADSDAGRIMIIVGLPSD